MIPTNDHSALAWALRETSGGAEEGEEEGEVLVTGTASEEEEEDVVGLAVTAMGSEGAEVAEGDVVASVATAMVSEGGEVVALATAGALGITMMKMGMPMVMGKDSRGMERVASEEDVGEVLATAGVLGIVGMMKMGVDSMVAEEASEVAGALEIVITVMTPMDLVTVDPEEALAIGKVVALEDVVVSEGVGGEGKGAEVSGGDSIRAQA